MALRIKVILFSGILLVGMIVANRYIHDTFTKKTDQFKHMKNTMSSLENVKRKAIAVDGQKRKLVPEDPAKYGIIVIPRDSKPRTQAQWDRQIEKVFKETNVLNSAQAPAALKKMEMPAQETEDKLSELDRRIAALREEQRKNPLDKNIERQLESSYKLKALGNYLKEKVRPTE